MTDERESNPLAVFLGLPAGTDAFGVLGLRADEHDREAIMLACEARLRQIDAHPLGATPEGDEARLEVHLAAAALLDSGLSQPFCVGVGEGRETDLCAQTPQIKRFVVDARRAIAAAGGWNARTLPRIASIAVMHGVPIEAIRPALESLDRRATHGRVPRAVEDLMKTAPFRSRLVVSHAAPPDEIDPGWQTARLVGVIVLLIVVSIAILGGVLYGIGRMMPGGDGVIATDPADSDSPSVIVRTPHDESDYIPPVRDDLDSHQLVVREFKTAARVALADPASGSDRFVRALDAWLGQWADESSDQRADSIDTARSALGALTQDAGAFDRGLSILHERVAMLDDVRLAGPRVQPVAGGAGLIAVCAQSDVISPTERRRLRALLAGFSPPRGGWGSFDRATGGVLGWLGDGHIQDDPAAWAQWIDAVQAVTHGDPSARERLLRSAIEGLLSRRSEPDAGESSSIRLLAVRLSWRAESGSRRWLVRLFDDPHISTRRLGLLTSAVGEASNASGIDATMVLEAAADAAAREEMAKRYADAWRVVRRAAPDLFTQGWLDAYDRLGATRAAGTGEPGDALRRAIAQARLNTARAMAQRGDLHRASELVDDVVVDSDPPAKARSSGSAFGSLAGDGAWMIEYSNANGDTPARIGLLGRLGSSSTRIGRADARLLVHETFRGSPRKVREAAQAAFAVHAQDASVLAGLIDQIGSLPVNERTRTTLASAIDEVIRSDRGEPFERAAARALTNKLIHVLGVDSGDRAGGELIAQLRELYALRLGRSDAAELSTIARRLGDEQGAMVDPDHAGDRLDPARIIATRRARLLIVSGGLQTAAIELRALVELTASRLGGDWPSMGLSVRRVVDHLDAVWEEAEHAGGQVEACERALTELNRLEMVGGER